MKTVVLGVSGCIAAYKALEVLSILKKRGINVKIIMTRNATEFVAPLSFETLSRNKVTVGTFEPKERYEVEHVSLAVEARAFVIAPATANVIAKIAQGVADDMLTTTALALPSDTPKIVAPAMNDRMYENEATVKNLEILKERGWTVVEPAVGILACGTEGKGKLAAPEEIAEAVVAAVFPKRDYEGRTVLITAGGTEEPIDPVRVITNRSSGKMGAALATAVLDRGGKAIVVAGRITAKMPKDAEVFNVSTTADMHARVLELAPLADTFILAAAPSDYRPKNAVSEKIKGNDLVLELVKNPDIAASLGEIKGGKKLVIFAAETSSLIENAVEKLKRKNADIAVANDVMKEGAGFDVDTNIATIIRKDGSMREVQKVEKSTLADIILDEIK